MGPPQQVLQAIRDRLGITHFVETGTLRGETAAWAAGVFGHVTTIELSETYHRAAVARFARQSSVQPLFGDSATILQRLVPTLSGPAIFWLDAHWSGLDTAGSESECPVMAEIQAINSSGAEHVILVDDARLFCSPPPKPHKAEQWPDLITIVTALAQQGRRYVALFEDVLLAFPAVQREFAVELLQDAASKTHRQQRRGWWARLVQ